jgi:hypothetical protein
MKRIDTSTKAVDLFGSGKHGYRDGNKALGIAPTDFNASSLNALQEEIANVIEPVMPLNAADNTQLKQAIQSMIAAGVVAPTDYIVRYTTIGNVVLSGLGTQAGGDWPGALNDNDPILVRSNTTGTEDGWYNAHAGAWTRCHFADTSAEIKSGFLTQVTEGSTLADTIWMLTTDGAITLNTTPLVFVRKDSQREQRIFPVDAHVAGNDLIATLAAGTPVDFRSSTLGSGAVITLTNASQLSVTAPNGASLGSVSGVKSRIALVSVNDNGTSRLGLKNMADGENLDETTLITTTAISAGSTSSSVFYSTVAVVAPSPFKLLGYVESTQAVAGTWSNPPSTVQGAGGQPWRKGGDGALRLAAHNGYGTVNTTILRFITIISNTGDDWVYTDSVANGGSILIVNGGRYVGFHVSRTANAGEFGISLNSTQLNTNIGLINQNDRIAYSKSGAGGATTTGFALRLNAGDILRGHGDATTDLDSTVAILTLVRIGD